MGNHIFAKIGIITIIISLIGCKTKTTLETTHIEPKNSITVNNGNLKKKYQQYDEFILKWVSAYKDGDDVGIVNYGTKLARIAKIEENEVKTFLSEYLKNKKEDLKPYIYISLVLAGFTDNCAFIATLEQYLVIEDKELLANALLGMSKLTRCNFNLNQVLWLLEHEFDESVILNALQVVLQYNDPLDIARLEKIIEKFIRHRNPLITNQSIRLIAKYKIGKFTKVLVNEFLSHPLIFIRTNTAMALSLIGDRSIIKELIDKMNAPSFIGKKETAYVLENLTGQKFGLDAQAWLFWYIKNFDTSE
ncbi:MAG: hypothetical protein ACK4NF_05235 [Planctomycetota bacterium]